MLQATKPSSATYQQAAALLFGGQPSLSALNTDVKALRDATKRGSANATVADANSAWVQEGLTLNSAFQAAAASILGAEALRITTAAAVNHWVSDKTHGEITEVIDEAALRDRIFLLINALYFKAKWQYQINKNDTQLAPFHLADGSEMPAMTMYRKIEKGSPGLYVASLGARTAAGAGVTCQLLQLPFALGTDYAGVVALPTDLLSAGAGGRLLVGGAPTLAALAACRSALLRGLVGGGISWGQTPTADVHLQLPRFETRFGAKLKETLKKMGLTALFSSADISGLVVGQSLSADEVIHKV